MKITIIKNAILAAVGVILAVGGIFYAAYALAVGGWGFVPAVVIAIAGIFLLFNVNFPSRIDGLTFVLTFVLSFIVIGLLAVVVVIATFGSG
ncbi:MAG TPA: hypothetical protein VIK53_12675 [Verrucomicrobiae bacterium]